METELPLLEPTVEEKIIIKQLETLFPQLDYHMCLHLVKSTPEELELLKKEYTDNPVQFLPMSYTLKNDDSMTIV
tara:strand:+ start:244 stop:468 length:225 start_codon:yes stop_codon:yes gene_type:complete